MNTQIELTQLPVYVASDVVTTETGKPTPTVVLKGDFGRVIHISFEAGQQVPAHKHPNNDVIVQVLSGELEHTMNSQTTLIKENNLIHFSGDNEVGLHNTSNAPTQILVTLIKREAKQ